MNAWETTSKVTILNHSRFLSVENHTIKLPDGTIIEEWPWIITPDYINVIAQNEEGKFICFRQTKYSIKGVSIAPAGGYINPGEDPLTAAKRELLEESGYKSDQWKALGSYSVDGNRGAGTAHLFFARSARKIAAPNKDDLEEQELILMTREELHNALKNGNIKVLSWAAAVSLALDSLD